MKKTMTKIFALVLVLAMVIGFVAMIPAQAAEIDSVVVAYHNVYFEDYLQIMYAVYVPDGKTIESIKLSDGTNEFAAKPYSDDKPIPQYNGKDCQLFVAATGVSLQNIDTVVTAEIYVDGAVAATDTYSVLQYLHKRLVIDDLTGKAAEKAMYESLLDTAEKMQTVINGSVTLHNTSYVHVTNGTVDGINADGMVTVGQALSGVTCDLIPGANQEIVWTVTEYVNGIARVPAQKTPEQVNALVVEEGVNLVLSAELTEADAPTTKEIVFEMGEDGAPSHSDGNSETATYSETVDGYTLSLTGGSKMCPSARDLTGNGAMKFGTTSVAGTFTTTVPNDVTRVILYVAGYKANTAKIQINSGEVQTISTLSNNGEYTAVEIDTTTNKTITFTTVSGGYRAMLNTVKFVVKECNHNNTTAVEAKAATCTEIGYAENTVFCNDCQCYISGGEIAATGHQNTVNRNVVAPTCVNVGTHDVFCSDCQTTIQTGVETPATGVHTYVEGVCTGCGASEGAAVEPTTVSVTMANTGWTSGTKYTTLALDENITASVTGSTNTGKYYTSDSTWRIYQNENPTLTISAASGTIKSVKITYVSGSTGTLKLNGNNVASDDVVTVNAASVTFNVGNTGSVKNGQVKVTAIEVVYEGGASAASLSDYATTPFDWRKRF